MADKKTEVKNIPVNKYSIHDLKNAIDTRIIEYLESKKFVEIHTYSNIKILLGIFCLIWTAVAYLNGLAFTDAYRLIALSVFMYFSGSLAYWYFEKYVMKSTFYTGKNLEILKDHSYFKISSEIEDYSNYYTIWLSYSSNGKELDGKKLKKCFSEFFDERGYCLREDVNKFAQELIESLKNNKKHN
jgi:hypothetical protein